LTEQQKKEKISGKGKQDAELGREQELGPEATGTSTAFVQRKRGVKGRDPKKIGEKEVKREKKGRKGFCIHREAHV